MNSWQSPGALLSNPFRGAAQLRRVAWRAGLLAGVIAILVNTAMLHASHLFGIDTGDGGLLKFLAIKLGFAPIDWQHGLLALLPMSVWKTVFHVMTGMGMALFYIGVIVPLLQRKCSPTVMGLLYGAALWMINAAWILPSLGMGFAGADELEVGGIAYYALAHTVFFMLLAWLYAAFRQHQLPSGQT